MCYRLEIPGHERFLNQRMERSTSSKLVSSPLFGIRIVATSVDLKPFRAACREAGTFAIT